MRRKKSVERDLKGGILMSKKTLRILCEKDDLYELPELNEKIYLHFKGFTKIENLDEYYNLKTIWLENNCLRKIENLHHLKSLSSLFLQNNFIEKIENLNECKNLVVLNLSKNKMTSIGNLTGLFKLQNLDVSQNYLQNSESISGLKTCFSLTNLDISKNLIEESKEIIDNILGLDNLACLYLHGNPFVKECKNYRKKFISSCQALLYFDDKPISPDERRLVSAWNRGGIKEEAEEKEKIIQEKQERNKQASEAFKLNSQNIKRKKKFFFEKCVIDDKVKLDDLLIKRNAAISIPDNESEIYFIERDIVTIEKDIRDFSESVINLSENEINPIFLEYSKIDSLKKDIHSKDQKSLHSVEEDIPEIKEININIDGDNNEPSNEIENISIQQANIDPYWNKEFTELLQVLTLKEMFDFEKISSEFQQIIERFDNTMHFTFSSQYLKAKWLLHQKTIN